MIAYKASEELITDGLTKPLQGANLYRVRSGVEDTSDWCPLIWFGMHDDDYSTRRCQILKNLYDHVSTFIDLIPGACEEDDEGLIK